jgi:hypothetical protein
VNIVRYLFQLALYVPLMALLGTLSSKPAFTHVPPEQALVRLSVVHAAQRKVECRTRTQDELAKLSPNMRAAQDCPRERLPLVIELELDGRVVYRHEAAPAGLRKDGASSVYHRMLVPAGAHRFVARLRDGPGEGFNYQKDARIDFRAGGSLLIDFNAGRGGFLFRG